MTEDIFHVFDNLDEIATNCSAKQGEEIAADPVLVIVPATRLAAPDNNSEGTSATEAKFLFAGEPVVRFSQQRRCNFGGAIRQCRSNRSDVK